MKSLCTLAATCTYQKGYVPIHITETLYLHGQKVQLFLDAQGEGRGAFGYTNVGPRNTDIFKRCHSDRESFKSALGLLACRMVHSYMHMHTNTRGTTLNSILYIYTHYIHVYMYNIICYTPT